MNNFLLFLAGLLVLALSALFAAPYFINWNDYRGVFEAQASRLVGRTVAVGGDVSLTLLPAPVLRFENVNVADAQGRFDTPFLSARSFTIWLSVPPLLRGAIEAREVELDQPVLNLQIGPDGTGNWRDVGRPDVSLPFVPRTVVLDSVKIVDGSVMLARGDEDPYLQLDHLDGELSVLSLQGPYKFAGHFEAAGGRTEMRFSTSRREASGRLRLKALVRDASGRKSYLLDGDVDDLGAAPRFQGAFEARFIDAGAEAKAPDPKEPAAADTAPVAIKARVEAGLQRAAFTDLEITIRRSDKPQTIRGKLDVRYGDGLAVEGALATRWVNLDALAGAGKPDGSVSAPVSVTTALARLVLGYAARVRDGRLTLAFEQAVLGGDLLQDLEADIAANAGAVTLQRLAARLPGDNRLKLSGALEDTEEGPSFTGALQLDGEKLNRLVNWAGFATPAVAVAQDGAFALSGALSAAPGHLALSEGKGSLFGSLFTAAVRYTAGEKRELALKLESARLDITRIIGARAEAISLPALLSRRGGADVDGREPPALAWLGKTTARIDLEIGAVTLPGLGESALRTALRIVDGDLDIQRLDLKSDTGLTLRANGRLTGIDRKPKGNITIAADAGAAPGIRALAGLLELKALADGQDERLRALAPLSLKAAVRSPDGDATGLIARVGGTLAKSEIGLDIEIDRPPAEWRSGRLTLALSAANADGRVLLRQLLPRAAAAAPAFLKPGPGRFSVSLKGTVREGLASEAMLAAAGLDWRLSGRFSLDDDGFGYEGRARGSLPDAAIAMRLAGLRTAPAGKARPVSLAGAVKASNKLYEVTGLQGDVAGDTFNGKVRLDLSAAGPRIEADIAASAASLPLLLGPLVAWSGPDKAVAPGVTATRGYWPEETIETGLLKGFDGRLGLKAARLRLTERLSVADGVVDARLSDGILDIATLKGSLYGGTLKARAKLFAQGNVLRLEADAEARDMRLERIARRTSGQPLARGPASFDVSFRSTGLSPHGLVAGLNGDGKLSLGKGEIDRLAPGVAGKVAKETGTGEDAKAVTEQWLRAAVRRHLKASGFAYGPFKSPIEIRNGVVRIEKAVLSNPSGRASVTTFVELTSMKLDSEWLLVAAAADAERAPRVSLTFAGPLADVGAMEPEIGTQALQRYVTIRRMEKDVERLEKLEVPKPDKADEQPKPPPLARRPSAEPSPPEVPSPLAATPPPSPPAGPPQVVPPLPTRAPPPPAPAPPSAVVAHPPPAPVAPVPAVRQRPGPAAQPPLPWFTPAPPGAPPVPTPPAAAQQQQQQPPPPPEPAAQTPAQPGQPEVAAPRTRERQPQQPFRNLDLLRQDGG